MQAAGSTFAFVPAQVVLLAPAAHGGVESRQTSMIYTSALRNSLTISQSSVLKHLQYVSAAFCLKLQLVGMEVSLTSPRGKDILPEGRSNMAFVLVAANTVYRAERLEVSTHCLETGMPCSELAARMLAPAVCTIPVKRHTFSFVAQLILHSMTAINSSLSVSNTFETQCTLGSI